MAFLLGILGSLSCKEDPQPENTITVSDEPSPPLPKGDIDEDCEGRADCLPELICIQDSQKVSDENTCQFPCTYNYQCEDALGAGWQCVEWANRPYCAFIETYEWGCELPSVTPSWSLEDDPCLTLEGKLFGYGESDCILVGFLNGLLYYHYADGYYEILVDRRAYTCTSEGTSAAILDRWGNVYSFDLQTGLLDGDMHLVDEHFADTVSTWFYDLYSY
jgi:hypothetical protein